MSSNITGKNLHYLHWYDNHYLQHIFVEEMKILYIFVIFSTFRLIRFFPGGKVVMTTTADEPAQAVKIFNNMQG